MSQFSCSNYDCLLCFVVFIINVSRSPFSLLGSVIAIYGAEKNDGKFTVDDFCTADLPPQAPRTTLSSDRYTHTHHT